MAGWILAAALALALASAAIGSFPEPGEWPHSRRTDAQDARSPIKGSILSPSIAWRHFVGRLVSLVKVEPAEDGASLAVPSVNAPARSGWMVDPRWGLVPPESQIAGTLQPAYRSSTTTYADVLPDSPGLEKIVFESSFSKPTVNNEWQKCVGRLYAWQDGDWTQVWETEQIDLLFSPLPLVGDFDADGQLEVAVLPWREVLVFEAATGRIKDRCKFTAGRSYGFFGVYDLDGDGKMEFVVQADYAKHVDVVGYRDGKLQLLWQREIEMDFANPQKVLRVPPDPVADLDGDGGKEVMVSLYNESGDGRWRTTIHDGITGAVRAVLEDEYLCDVIDLDGDGASELLTARVHGSGVPDYGRISIYGFADGNPRNLWSCEDAAWADWEPYLPEHVNSWATLGSRRVLWRVVDGIPRLVIRKRAQGQPDRGALSVGTWRRGKMEFTTSVEGPDAVAVAMDEQGTLMVRCTTEPGESGAVSILEGTGEVVLSAKLTATPFDVAVVRDSCDRQPTIIVQGWGEELVLFHPRTANGPPHERLRIRGRGQATNWPYGPPGQNPGPVAADLYGDGRRQHIYATSSPQGCGRIVVADLDGREIWTHDFPDIPGGPPIWNVGGVILWQTGHFTTPAHRDVLVTVRRSVMHSEETYVLSGLDGSLIWRQAHQISDRGVGGTPFAIADFDGNGLDDVASFHPSVFYILDGATGKDLITMDTIWDEVPAKPVYWGCPIAGDFEGKDQQSVFFGTHKGSMIGLVRADGTLVWSDAVECGPSLPPAFGDFTGSGAHEAIVPGFEENEIRCYDTATGAVRWRIPIPGEGLITGIASADIDSDGRDEALFTRGRTLYCIGTDKADAARGAVIWSLNLPALLGPPSIADLEGNGEASILVVCHDGYVYCIR